MARDKAEDVFRDSRYTEPLEMYLENFDTYQDVVEEILEETVDLSNVSACLDDIMGDVRKREVFRYLTGPPVSEDDLKVLVDAASLVPARIREDRDLFSRLVSFFRDWHDRRRFPWVSEGWEPHDHQRNAAVVATSALLAMRRLETDRRHSEKTRQEDSVERALARGNLRKVDKRKVSTLSNAPRAGEFCRESVLGTRKADFIIGLWDGRTLAIECKVSNSATNSVKRLNNDVVAKAEAWTQDFGTVQTGDCRCTGWCLQDPQFRRRPKSRPIHHVGTQHARSSRLDPPDSRTAVAICCFGANGAGHGHGNRVSLRRSYRKSRGTAIDTGDTHPCC